MVSTNTNTKTKNTVLLALISTTFILSIVSYAHPQTQQQAFAQGFFQSQQEESEALNNQSSPVSTTTPTSTTPTEASVENGEETRDQKIILGDITIPINSNTTLSLEMQDSKITVQPNQ
jgi:negative regulator of sigma E activity